MNIKNNIITTEIEYSKCFSEVEEKDNILRFRDDSIKDMYSHNFTYIKQVNSLEELNHFLEKELAESKSNKKAFLNVRYEIDDSHNIIKNQECKTSVNDYFQFPIDYLDQLVARNDCSIIKFDKSQLVPALEYDLRVNEEELGTSFVQRRFERRSKVYLSEGLVDHYLCYYEGKIIGHCDLFIDQAVAKIEDFHVAPEMQRKGFGTAILKELITIAVNKGASILYLITEDDDTAKEMYQKCGMKKVGEMVELFYEF